MQGTEGRHLTARCHFQALDAGWFQTRSRFTGSNITDIDIESKLEGVKEEAADGRDYYNRIVQTCHTTHVEHVRLPMVASLSIKGMLLMPCCSPRSLNRMTSS